MVILDPSGSVSPFAQVVCGHHVGHLIRERKTTVCILTSRDLVEVSVNAPMRVVISRELAQQIVEALCRGEVDPASLPVWAEVWQHRDVLLAELAAALGCSERLLRVALRRKDASFRRPECPWPLAGYEYMGSFRAEKGLVIADRCYINREHKLLAIKTPCLAGTWHGYLRHDPNFSGRTVSILVVHENHFDLVKHPGEELGVFGVDAGCAVIVDQRVLDNAPLLHALTETSDWDEGIIEDAGIFSYTYDGDGVYRARAILQEGVVVALRVNVSRDEDYDYHTPPPSEHYTKSLAEEITAAGPAKPYATTETFAVGDQVTHKKFGLGLVKRAVDAGKVEIAFPEGMKTLVHAQKK